MAYTITRSCINCSRCLPECPTGAIELTNGKYSINSELCNDCAGYYSVPQCRATCPTNHGCIPSNSLNQIVQFNPTLTTKTYWENWLSNYQELVSKVKNQAKPKTYWENWFNTYNSLISKVQGSAKTERTDYWEEWFKTYEQMRTQLQGTASNYWEHWFDCYANTCQPILEE